MKMTMKTGLAALVLLLAMSCTKENSTIIPAGNNDESATQLATVGTKNLTINVVRIGRQIWQKKDLATTYYRNGDRIPEVKDPTK